LAEHHAPFAGTDRKAGARFSLARTTLTDFRCYVHERIETDERPVVLTGPNGAGKTNLLEAISFLAPGRGLRGAQLGAVARRAGPDDDSSRNWAVAARVRTPRGEVDLGTGRGADAAARDRRLARIDGRPARGHAEFAEHISVVWLTPAMDRLFIEGAAPRRRFLDRLVYGFDPAHARRVTAYEHALRERARLLRESRRPDQTWLAALEDAMASAGVAIAAARREVAARLDRYARPGNGVFPGAAVAVRGGVESWLEGEPALAVEDRFREGLAGSRAADAEAGGAAIGPHRTDLAVIHAAKGLPAADCSTGEQKTLLIGLVLANAAMLTAERGAVPILLLDEVAAHLDPVRRAALFEQLSGLGAQAWMAGTDPDVFRPFGGTAQFFTVREGRVARTA
jgi:DNA replication and repair protein RecF